MMRRLASALLGAVLCVVSVPARAADPQPFAEFTFKRVKPPQAGATRRITVQIEPKPEAPDPEAETAEAPTTDAYAWYWSTVSPDLEASGPGRLAQAITHLSQGPGVRTPRLQEMQTIAQAHGTRILSATVGTKVSPALVLAVIGTESSGRVDAVSEAGAQGLMQLMPATASRFGVTDATDPAQNIRGGVLYLDWLMQEFDNDPILVLAGYNAGENAVRSHAGVPPYAETRAYVPKVLAAWTVARGLCLTPPELISDGCALALAAAPDG